MAAETQEALKEQEKRLGLLIGRLEVGTARRQAILSKQDATLQNLQVCNEKTQHYNIYRYVITHNITKSTGMSSEFEEILTVKVTCTWMY